ncbi:hypothetical protein A3A36_00815 [Candidatus Kaiserbacteria bacterium RIFCSPLOWO2_01_FULL_52_12b]|uniref:Uncharacterized protein n=1 Tax=Candidatus Kaiserbacteria bacterium RIFCSPLOWO2_01_FULL_52_12b TaxID=1798509 RepID=A0A1F6EXI0_9BACT|nr:MAG: hypothetical protein A3A36_00815 [Candidatus Kaiserbacteria bacterium RIFCSPLOWO2_01_FULL_52_12b]
MTTLVYFLVFCQALGALLGTLMAIWGELAYVRSMRDGNIDHAERAHLHAIARGLRFGMSLLLFSSFALVVVMYVLQASQQPALTESYWTFIALVFLVIGASWALSRKRISFALGSAVAFTAWWFLTFLTSGQLPTFSFGATVALYVVGVAILYALFHYTRLLLVSK